MARTPTFGIKTLSLQEALGVAVSNARLRVGDPLARVAFVVASKANAEQVRRLLGERGAFIHVDFLTPDQLVSSLGLLPLVLQGFRPEPSGWLGAWLHRNVPLMAEALGRHGATLRQPGWRGPIQSALGELQAGRVSPAQLRALSGEGGTQAERFGLMAAIMEAVEQARAEQRFLSQSALEDSALAQIEAGADAPCQSIRAAIVLGDGILSPGVSAALKAWFSSRDLTRIALQPLERLSPAPWGLRAAAQGAHLIEVMPTFSRLGHLQGVLFSGRLAMCAALDDSVQVVSTPDEVREMSEVVRVVQRAIGAGVALDRIAIVLPDADNASALAEALQKASIPATWLTAAPLINEPCARFLLLALSLARGEHTVAALFDLLTQPGVMGLSRTGRGRWRSALSHCPPGQGIAGIVDHLQQAERQAELDDEEATARALGSLLGAIQQMMASIDAFPAEAMVGAHGKAWSAFLERWWRPSPERDRVMAALDGWGGAAEVSLSISAASQILAEELAAQPSLRGSLTQATVRIMPPMGLLGGAFDLVCVTGLSEGRFPRHPKENPLLTDAMVRALQDRGGQLATTDQLIEVEKRRLAAVVSACRGVLWMSSPRTDMLDSTPRLPGWLLLDVLSTLEGRRVRYGELSGLLQFEGSRSRPLASTPEVALGPGEYLLARAIEAPEALIPVLASHPTARRLMQLHRSVDRLRLGEAVIPDAWTGLVSRELLDLGFLSGEALSPEDLATLALDPAGFFMKRQLGVFPARSLRRVEVDMSASGIRREVLKLVLEAVESGEEPLEEVFARLWEARLEAIAAWLGVDSADEAGRSRVGMWRQQGLMARDTFMAAHGGQLGLSAAVVHEGIVRADQPLKISGGRGRLSEGSLVMPSTRAGVALKASHEHTFKALAQGFALQQAGQRVERLVVAGVDGGRCEDFFGKFEGEFDALLACAARRAGAGWWPMVNPSDPFALARERAVAGGVQLERDGIVLERLESES